MLSSFKKAMESNARTILKNVWESIDADLMFAYLLRFLTHPLGWFVFLLSLNAPPDGTQYGIGDLGFWGYGLAFLGAYFFHTSVSKYISYKEHLEPYLAEQVEIMQFSLHVGKELDPLDDPDLKKAAEKMAEHLSENGREVWEVDRNMVVAEDGYYAAYPLNDAPEGVPDSGETVAIYGYDADDISI